MADQLPGCPIEEQCPVCEGDGVLTITNTHPTESYYCFTERVRCSTCGGMGLISGTTSTRSDS